MMTKWEKLKRLLKNSLQATARTFSNPRAKFGTGIAKGKKLYGQVTTYLPVLKTKVGKVPMWGWITILTVFMLSSFILMGYWMVRWAVTNAPKLIKFDTLENWDLQAAVGLLIVFVLIAYMTRKKKPKAPTTGTQAGKTAPAAVAQAAATTASPTPTTKKEDEEGLSFLKILSIILLFIGLHVLWFLAVGSWWISNIGFNKVSWAVHAVLLIALFNLPKGKAPKNQTMARFAIVVVLFVFLPYQAYNNANWGGGQTQAAITTKPIVTPEKDPCIEDDPQHGPDKDRTIKALANHPFLFALACRETRFNHRDPENPTKVFQGKIDKDDTGIMQINKRIHKDLLKEKGLNADVFEDSIAFAKFLHDEDKKGIDHWFPLVSGRRYDPITVIVVASKDTWSPVVKIPKLTSGAEFKIIKPVLAEIDGREVIFDPKVDHHWGSVKQIRFKSIDGAKTTIRITFNFWPVP